jgi:NAD(P)-dependent dehydrogenase (short-subunit alcohol dehydrogenase family)
MNMTTTSPRTALVTGASRGLGRAIARALADAGWELIIDARGADALEETRASLASSTRVIAIAGDIASSKHRARIVEAAAELGGLDAVINNAGILGASPLPALLAYPLDRLEETLRINTIAPLALLQAVNDELRDGARIVNVTSDAAVEAYAGWGGYAASKAALEALSRVLAVENPDLRVYEVDPGDMRTAMHQEAFPGEDISDRAKPESSVPGILALLDGDLPSGRYRATELVASEVS